jgi:predicted site-specific integrase-resolvase
MDGLLILKEVATRIDISYTTAKRWKREGKLPEPAIAVGRLKWSEASIEDMQKRPKETNRDHSRN